MQVDFKPRLRGIAKLILSLLAQLGSLLTSRIKDEEVRLMAQGLVGATSETIDALSDADPDDKEQIRDIFNGLLKDGPFKEGSKAELMARINDIEDIDTRLLLSQVLTQSYPIGDILTDSDTANSEQMREYLRDLLRTEDGMIMLRSFFGIILPDDYATTASLLVIQLLLTVLEEEGTSPALASRLVELRSAYQNKLLTA